MKIWFEISIETKYSSRDSLTSLELVFNLGITHCLQFPWQILNTLHWPSDFNLLTQKDFSDQVKMNNEPLQSGSTHNRQHVWSVIEFRKLRFISYSVYDWVEMLKCILKNEFGLIFSLVPVAEYISGHRTGQGLKASKNEASPPVHLYLTHWTD